jgi:TolB-like protein
MQMKLRQKNLLNLQQNGVSNSQQQQQKLEQEGTSYVCCYLMEGSLLKSYDIIIVTIPLVMKTGFGHDIILNHDSK